MANDNDRRVAFCGLGIMGGPMAANLADAGFELSVYTRTREKAERFAQEHEGATAAASPREAAEGASAVITMVPDAPEVEQVLFGPDGAAEGLSMVDLVIDMSTIRPSASRAIGERLRGQRGAGVLVLPREPLRLLARARVDGQLEARPREVRGHRAAHDPEAAEGHPPAVVICHIRRLQGFRCEVDLRVGGCQTSSRAAPLR